jgi:hypothetical protein
MYQKRSEIKQKTIQNMGKDQLPSNPNPCIPNWPHYTLGPYMYITILYIIRARLSYERYIATGDHEKCKQALIMYYFWCCTANGHSITHIIFNIIIYGICTYYWLIMGRECRDSTVNQRKHGKYK